MYGRNFGPLFNNITNDALKSVNSSIGTFSLNKSELDKSVDLSLCGLTDTLVAKQTKG